jgi:hypothetical protein
MKLLSYLVISLFSFFMDDAQQNNIIENDESIEFDEYGNPMYLENSLLKRH